MTDEAISPLRRRMMRINQSLHHLVIRANTRFVMQVPRHVRDGVQTVQIVRLCSLRPKDSMVVQVARRDVTLITPGESMMWQA
jgi:hypothetical protein